MIPTLRAMCREVVEAPDGTADSARVRGLSIGGKTGTAQVASPTGGYLRGVYTPSFVGFVRMALPFAAVQLLLAVVYVLLVL